MRIKNILLSFLLITIFPGISFAASFGSYDYDVQAFKQTRDLCQSQNQYFEFGKFFFQGIVNGAALWKIGSTGASPETLQFIHSDGFKGGLYACFGADENKQNHFKYWIIGSDVAGHMVGVAAWLIPTTFLFKYLRSVSFLNRPLRVLSVVNKVALVGLPAAVAYDYYEQSQVQNDRKTMFVKSNGALVDMIRIAEDDSYALLREQLKQVNQQLAERPLDVDRENKLLHRKAILEERLQNQNAPERYVH